MPILKSGGETGMTANRLVTHLSTIALFVAGGALVAMMLHVVADVFGKYFFNTPIPGTIEVVAWYYMVAVAFLPVAYVQVKRQHLMVELFTMSLSPRRKLAFDGVVAILGSLYSGLLAWLLLGDALESTARGDVQDLTFFYMPIWPTTWVLPVSFGLLTIVFVVQAFQDLTGALRATDPAPAGTDPAHLSPMSERK